MATTVEHKTKKRKHAAAETAGEPSTKRSKTATEKKTKHKSKDGKKKDGSGKHTGGQFKVVRSTLAISLPPVFAGRPREGAEEMLDSLVMRYVPALQGVLLAHDSLQFLSSSATIKGDCPFANCTISFSSTVWSPRVGMKLVGKVNLCSPDHVSLLVHRTFNVSIPRHHIPTDNWEFEYGPAENDPEFGGETADATEGDGAPSEAVESSGRWVHKLTGEKLGGENGSLEFTVIGLTIANQMLSLVGSIQHDPFSPEHVPDHSTITVSSRKQPATQSAATFETFDREEDANSDEDVDTFETLARLNNEAEEVEGAQKSKQKKDDEEKKEKKRKRKSEKAAAQADDGADGQPEKKRKKKKDPSS